MTILIDAMLEVARLLGGVKEGTATGGSTTTLIDTNIDDDNEIYTGGTLWMLSGTNDNLCVKIKTHSEGGVITLPSTLSAAIAAADTYAIAPPKFPKHILKQACNYVLRMTDIIAVNTTLVVTDNTQAYTLPAGVFDVRRVEIERDDTKGDYEKSYFWREANGSLYFDAGKEPTMAGKTIRLWYVTKHGELSESGTIDTAVDWDYLVWGSVAYCYRNLIQRINKDSPMALELLNEAKTMEGTALRQAKAAGHGLMHKDPHWGRW